MLKGGESAQLQHRAARLLGTWKRRPVGSSPSAASAFLPLLLALPKAFGRAQTLASSLYTGSREATRLVLFFQDLPRIFLKGLSIAATGPAWDDPLKVTCGTDTLPHAGA